MTNDTRPTIDGVRTIGVPVTDQDRALDFYLNTLGFEKRLDAPVPQFGGRWIEVAPANTAITIALVPAREDTPAHGAEVGEVLRWPGVPPMFKLRDQDGNGLEVVEA
jgi:lactoylglutathione lyase